MLMMPIHLETRRLTIKKLSLENAENIFRVYVSDPRANALCDVDNIASIKGFRKIWISKRSRAY